MIYDEQFRYYFGTESPNGSSGKCNVCSVTLSMWGDDRERHIAFHESLMPKPALGGIWTLTDAEYSKELEKAWHEGQRAAIAWQMKHDRGDNREDPKCPYEGGKL